MVEALLLGLVAFIAQSEYALGTSLISRRRRAAAAARVGSSTRPEAAQGAWTTAARGVGFD